jgi:NAD(P)-dependent dehydrogenase (short-subunit alcohol dehydrogenase family)
MGAAVAARLHGDRRLLLADRDLGAARRVADSLGAGVEAVACDVTDPVACDALAAQVPRLGALVVTAGLSPTMAAGEWIFAVNLVDGGVIAAAAGGFG